MFEVLFEFFQQHLSRFPEKSRTDIAVSSRFDRETVRR